MAADIIQPGQFAKNPNAPQPETPPSPEYATFEDLPITEAQHGEQLLGTLTDEEADLFVRYFNVNAEVMALDREANGAALVMMGNDYRSGVLHESMQKQQGYDLAKGADPAVMRDLHSAISEMLYLRHKLFWKLGERFCCHDWLMGVRTKRRVYKVRRKW